MLSAAAWFVSFFEAVGKPREPPYAHPGYSSSLAAATLLDLGYARATDVIGGFEAWAAAGLPVVPGDD